MSKNNYPGTLFIDIDGTLIKHVFNPSIQHISPSELLPGALEFLKDAESKCYRIILTTGRKESTRAATEKQLNGLGLFWDQLIMSLPRGKRIVVNDLKPNSDEPTAIAINPRRNVGLEGVVI